MALELEHIRVQTNGITLHVVAAGPESGPLVILLHGFPEFWYGWHDYIAPLVEMGYRVWVPDQRGYNSSDKPHGVRQYKTSLLVADVIGLIDAAGREKASLVAHDWGAAVAWLVALTLPQRVERLAILNMPHPNVLQRHLTRNPRQLARSWYIFCFQLPRIPEILLRARNWSGAVQLLRTSSNKGTFNEADYEQYRVTWSKPGAMTAMINWYRAAVRVPIRLKTSPRVTIPTLLVWGAKDVALGREMAQQSIAFCDDGRLVMIEEASHWVQHEGKLQILPLLADFLPAPQLAS